MLKGKFSHAPASCIYSSVWLLSQTWKKQRKEVNSSVVSDINLNLWVTTGKGWFRYKNRASLVPAPFYNLCVLEKLLMDTGKRERNSVCVCATERERENEREGEKSLC